jgi:hypothetical protein
MPVDVEGAGFIELVFAESAAFDGDARDPSGSGSFDVPHAVPDGDCPLRI